jgi:hypothetical protein
VITHARIPSTIKHEHVALMVVNKVHTHL